jgi:hypothetical protein
VLAATVLGAAGAPVRVDGETVVADLVELPFVEGSARSGRLLKY